MEETVPSARGLKTTPYGYEAEVPDGIVISIPTEVIPPDPVPPPPPPPLLAAYASGREKKERKVDGEVKF